MLLQISDSLLTQSKDNVTLTNIHWLDHIHSFQIPKCLTFRSIFFRDGTNPESKGFNQPAKFLFDNIVDSCLNVTTFRLKMSHVFLSCGMKRQRKIIENGECDKLKRFYCSHPSSRESASFLLFLSEQARKRLSLGTDDSDINKSRYRPKSFNLILKKNGPPRPFLSNSILKWSLFFLGWPFGQPFWVS